MLVWASINGKVVLDKITKTQDEYPVLELEREEQEELVAIP
jgi:hypothetical protein